jgi:hypothetical protein
MCGHKLEQLLELIAQAKKILDYPAMNNRQFFEVKEIILKAYKLIPQVSIEQDELSLKLDELHQKYPN